MIVKLSGFLFTYYRQISYWRNTHSGQKASPQGLIPQVDIQSTRICHRRGNKFEKNCSIFQDVKVAIVTEYFSRNRHQILLTIVFFKTVFCFAELQYCGNFNWRTKFTFQHGTRTAFEHSF